MTGHRSKIILNPGYSHHFISFIRLLALGRDVNKALFCFQLETVLMLPLQDRDQGMRNHCLLGRLLLLQET